MAKQMSSTLKMLHKLAQAKKKLSLGGAFYKHLMSGVSQMLPFVIGGGILIALAFLIDQVLGVPQDQLSQSWFLSCISSSI